MGFFDKKPTPAPVATHVSGINLEKGGALNLTKQAATVSSSGLGDAVVGCGWDANRRGSTFDLDVVAIALGANGKLPSRDWFVYYSNKKAPRGVIKHSGDNLTGEGEGDDEQIVFDFAAIPAEITRIVVAVNIYQAERKRQSFADVKNAFVRVFDSRTGNELVKYDLGGNFGKETVMIMGELYREGSDWNFRAIGEGTSQRELSSRYGTPGF